MPRTLDTVIGTADPDWYPEAFASAVIDSEAGAIPNNRRRITPLKRRDGFLPLGGYEALPASSLTLDFATEATLATRSLRSAALSFRS